MSREDDLFAKYWHEFKGILSVGFGEELHIRLTEPKGTQDFYRLIGRLQDRQTTIGTEFLKRVIAEAVNPQPTRETNGRQTASSPPAHSQPGK